MATARDLIKDALRKIQVLGKGQSLDSDEANDALRALNQMLASWSAEGSLVFAETRETFNLGSTISYTIGSGGDFDTTRPVFIKSAYTTRSGIDYPINQIDVNAYDRIPIKDLAGGGEPEYLYYDAAYPLATIYLYPRPTGGTITLTSVKQLTQFTSLNTIFNFPPEYEEALVYNLAIRLAPEYEREPARQVVKIARASKKTIEGQNERNNKPLADASVPDGNGGQDNNIYRGWFT